ncbi:MAG: hypothetical protein CMH56_08910 [Myxococcales bacterium]|nr:hypothetical protein [Myxococcales bacterium]|tara:strand:- start:1261 stop:1875 length:615 start_codon:yes stop_codon:yes gene_type:complete
MASSVEWMGVVLAGGQSRRMGQDKALLAHPKGGTFLDHLVGLFEQINIQTAISGHLPGEDNWPAPVISDELKGEGPLGGLISVLRAYPGKYLMCVAVDMPGLQAASLRYLMDKSINNSVLARCYALPTGEGNVRKYPFRPFPLVLAPQSLGALRHAFLDGERALMPVLAQLSPEKIPVSPLVEPTLFNVNTPEALQDYYDSVSP